jgi:hypothetical protein
MVSRGIANLNLTMMFMHDMMFETFFYDRSNDCIISQTTTRGLQQGVQIWKSLLRLC